MADWAITLGLMVCILIGGALSARSLIKNQKKMLGHTPQPGELTEPLRSQAMMQVGFTWMLASIVPFWRDHPGLAWVTLAIGLITFFQGCANVYRYGLAQARAVRAAQDNEKTATEDVLPGESRSAARRRRRAARREALKAVRSNQQSTTPLE